MVIRHEDIRIILGVVVLSKIFIRIALLAVVVVVPLGCAKKMADEPSEARRIEMVLKQHNDMLLALQGVVGTAIGTCDGKPCIRVLVAKKTPELLTRIPHTLEGVPVVTVETGEIRAF